MITPGGGSTNLKHKKQEKHRMGFGNSMSVGLQPLLLGEERFEILQHTKDTSQGRIYTAMDKTNNQFCIVKETWTQLIKMKRDRQGLRVSNDFHREKAIMYYLSNLSMRGPLSGCNNYFSSTRTHNMPFNIDGFVKIRDEWEDERCFFYAMDGCPGGELFEFIKESFTNKNGIAYKYSQHCLSYALPNQQALPQGEYNEWLIIVRDIFKQLCLNVAWMHENGVCHLDLSLENAMIYKEHHDNNNTTNTTRVIVKIIDFGAAHYFGHENLKDINRRYNDKKVKTLLGFKSKIDNINQYIEQQQLQRKEQMDKIFDTSNLSLLKQHYDKIQECFRNITPDFSNFAAYYNREKNKEDDNNVDENSKSLFIYNQTVGKSSYMAPEVCAKTHPPAQEFRTTANGQRVANKREARYDARSADIWSLGVMLFMMCIGTSPYNKPTQQDKQFRYIYAGRIRELLAHWKRLALITEDVLDLFERIFVPQARRITWAQLLSHPFLNVIDENGNVVGAGSVDSGTVDASTVNTTDGGNDTAEKNTLALSSESINKKPNEAIGNQNRSEMNSNQNLFIARRPLIVAICIGIYYQQEDLVGTIADYNNIINTFKNIHKLDVLYATDQGRPKFAWTRDQIFNFLSKIKNCQNVNLDVYDSLIVFISAHGTKNQILDSYSQPVSIDKIQQHFNSEKCPVLSAKPQLFFVDSCVHVTQNYTSTNKNNNNDNNINDDDRDKSDGSMNQTMVWTVFSSETDNSALESNKLGGYLIHSVTKVFGNNHYYQKENIDSNDNSVTSILKRVTADMAAMGAKPPIIQNLRGVGQEKNVIFGLKKQSIQSVHGREIGIETESNIVCLFILNHVCVVFLFFVFCF